MPLNLTDLKTPTAAGSKPVQAKYTLSTEARDKLRKASELTGQDMSTILEMLIRQELRLPGEVFEPPYTAAERQHRADEKRAVLGPDPRNATEDFELDV